MKKVFLLALVVLVAAGTVYSQKAKMGRDALDKLTFSRPELWVTAQHENGDQVMDLMPAGMRDAWTSFLAQNGSQWRMIFDRVTGRPALIEGQGIPWIPGAANNLTGADLGLDDPDVEGKDVPVDVAARLALEFLGRYPALLIVRPADLVLIAGASGPMLDYLYFIDFQWSYQGIPVERAHAVFRLNHGNLVQFGQEFIADSITGLDPIPVLKAEDAWEILWDYVGGRGSADEILNTGGLSILPVSTPEVRDHSLVNAGEGLAYKLVYTLSFRRPDVLGTWEAKVDARTGEILSFADANRYGYAHGGTFPGDRPTAEVDRLFPYVDCGGGIFANAAGYFSGNNCTSTLAGKYAFINDTCGPVSLSTTTGDLDFGMSGGVDCTTPGTGGTGNTHASRTQYYHVHQIKIKALTYLPGNMWLMGQLQDNVNLNQSCNAYWDGSTVNFFRSSGACDNTGELPGVSLHEFAHGLDQNDGYPPADYGTGETYGDFTGSLQTHSPCVGDGFFKSGNCEGYWDACLSCSGIRDLDWNNHASHTPHIPEDMASDSCSGCTTYSCDLYASYAGPCGYEGHCESYISSEAMWDLPNRDLTSWGLDLTTAWQTMDRFWYASRPTAGSAYSCPTVTTTSGCGSSSYFTVFRIADDCDGNLANGTPHASAIYNAFSRHRIACDSVVNTDQTGCCPTLAAPVLSAAAGNNTINLSWGAVTNAQKYNVFRNEAGCDAGFTKVGSVISPGTTFSDPSVVNGVTYYYRAQAYGSTEACFSPMSNCATIIPQPCTGSIQLNREVFNCADTITIQLTDSDLMGTGTQDVAVWSTQESIPETVTLAETPPNSAVFAGTIATSASTAHGDGAIGVVNGSTITIRYVDASYCGTPNVNVDKTAAVDCGGPVISDVQVTQITFNSALVTWTTDEYADSRVLYGGSTPPGSTVQNASLAIGHAVLVPNLNPCSKYFFSVSSTDAAHNTSTDTNGGAYYTFRTLGVVNIFSDDMEFGANGWTVESPDSNNLWHQTTDPLCSPASNSPTSSWYFGMDSNCTYRKGESERVRGRLRSPVISDVPPGAFLHFVQRRKTESYCGLWDRSFLEISTNGGTTWTQLDEVCEESNAWVQSPNYDLSAFAGQDIMLGFRFDTLDGFVNDFFGWMIDDMAISISASCRTGTVTLDQPLYLCSNDTIQAGVQDSDLNANPNVQETATATIESATETTPETVLLTEQGVDSAVFIGTILTTQTAPVNGDGKLSVANGDAITATYNDADDGSGSPAVVTAAAAADCTPLAISGVGVSNVTLDSATITWTTNKPASSKVTFGTAAPPSTMVDDPRSYVISHSVTLTGLSLCTTYYFSVASSDVLENTAADNNGGNYYSFVTMGRQYLLGPDDVENGAGSWTATGPAGTIWHIDTCRAFSGTHAWKAGSVQYCPGEPLQSTDTYLATLPLNLGALGHGYHLIFMHWWGTHNNSTCYVQISTDGGGSWTTVDTWYNESLGGARVWMKKDYDLALYSGNAIIRFWFHSNIWFPGYAPDGWYLDDLEVSRHVSCANGRIDIEEPMYGCNNDSITVTMEDLDLAGTGSQAVDLFSTTEPTPESVTLAESPANSGTFMGIFPTTAAAPVHGDGKLSVAHNDTITARYIDANDGNGHTNVIKTDSASIDCAGPVISNIQVIAISDIDARITWTTSEAANSRVTYGLSIPPGTVAEDAATLTTSHSIELTGLQACKTYYFSVTSADLYDNSTTDANGGAYYSFTTQPRAYAFGPDFVESGAGSWVISGDAANAWHVSTCRAHSPTHAWKAGKTDCAGTLSGGANSYLTSPAINLGAAGHGYSLKFWEWMEIAANNYVYVRISADGGGSWTTLEQRNGALSIPSWTLREFDLGAYTGNILLRFHLWANVVGGGGEGWYIDDIRVGKHVPCGYGTVTLDQAAYGCSQAIGITLEDSDLAGTGAHAMDLYSTLEPTPETVTLNETPAGSGIFQGTFPATATGPVHGDGKLSIATGNTITARYLDANDGQGHTNIYKYDTASADCAPPVISNVQIPVQSDYHAVITWKTDKPANSRVTWGTSTPPSTVSQDPATYVTDHRVELLGLSSCAVYYFSVTSADVYANTTTDSNGGAYYSFQSVGQTYALSPDNVESGSGSWTATGQWHISTCRAHSATHAWKIGNTACPGNLSTNTSSYLTSSTINLGSSGLGYYLKYWEWPNFNSSNYAYVQISTDGGGSWGNLEARSGPVTATSWTLKELSLETFSGNVMIRFYFNATIVSTQGEGWYVDDIRVGRQRSCVQDIKYASSSSFTEITGDGDAYFERGEKWSVNVTLRNDGLQNATNVQTDLAGNGISVCNNPGTFGNIPSGGTATYTYPFVVSPTFLPCGGGVGFDVINKICTERNPAGSNEMDKFGFTVGQQIIPPPVDLVIQPSSADSYVDEDNATSNYGTATTMIVRSRSTNRDARVLVQFDLTGIPVGSTVNSATLELFATAGGTNRTYDAHHITGTWTETGVTWNLQPAFSASPDVSIATGTAVNAWKIWTVAPVVQAWVNGAYSNYGFLIKDNAEEGSNIAWTFATKENGTAGNRPILRVNYTPPPSGWDCSYVGSGSCPSTVPKPVPDGRWVGGTPMKASKVSGNTVHITWDVTTCVSGNYNVYSGPLTALSTYAYDTWTCNIGASGSADAAVSGTGTGQFFVIVPMQGTTEGSHGRNSSGTERTASGVGHCAVAAKNATGTCP
jgi:hypothetical protein